MSMVLLFARSKCRKIGIDLDDSERGLSSFAGGGDRPPLLKFRFNEWRERGEGAKIGGTSMPTLLVSFWRVSLAALS
jgi:hypothetical protein